MSKLKVQMNFQISKFKLELVYNLAFDIHLAFACLREAASAKAGILTFEIYCGLKITYQSFSRYNG